LRDCSRAICGHYWLLPLVLVLDQLSKLLAERALLPGMPVELLPFLNLTLAYNTGAAFSFLHSAGGWQNLFFIAIAVVMSIALLVILARTAREEVQLAVALWLVLGGALGNLVDRVRIEKVVDFVDFHVGSWHFATFNIADAAITIGAALLILDTFGWRLLKPRQGGDSRP